MKALMAIVLSRRRNVELPLNDDADND